jgi:hypothetical protein
VRRESKERPAIVPVSLREVYAQPGEYTAKLMIDPEVSPGIEDVTLTVRNADGTPLRHSYRRWGTKLNLCFLIDSSTPDGVATVEVQMLGKSLKINKRFCFWIVK